MEILDLLNYSKRNNASDLHLTPNFPPCIRLHGEMLPFFSKNLTAEDIKAMLYSIITDAQRATFEKEMEMDFAVQYGPDMRFRVNAFTTIKGTAVVFRTIPTDVLTMEQLNLPNIFYKLVDLNKGLVLVTGPTGSGKSTTLASMINEINKKHKKHIITIEDPVEFVHKPINSIVNQRELKSNTKSFQAALKSALREDPDVILVGEMRDLETISLALTAAETGHLVFGTLHTTSAAKTMDRIIDVFPGEEKDLVRSMLSSSVQAIIAQTLMKTKEGKGRVAAFEVLLGTPGIRNLIRENKIPQINSMIQIGSKHGMISMKDSVTNLLNENKISSETATNILNIISNVADFEEKGITVEKESEVMVKTIDGDKKIRKSIFEESMDATGEVKYSSTENTTNNDNNF
ncbi:MAG TPA: type IV pili twitching motility protein PilT [Alphaproteobacteria bacterium]|nr:type IV pili twitching motility protein PilT [Alphaproteobacteria bacterium]